jgi:hypothetical protein
MKTPYSKISQSTVQDKCGKTKAMITNSPAAMTISWRLFHSFSSHRLLTKSLLDFIIVSPKKIK